MKTDTIFYQLFESFPSVFFELINCAREEADNYRFSSVEIKQLAFRLDGVFLPNLEQMNKPIYFAEVQFQTDAKFYSRFFSQIFLYLDKTDLENNWRGVIIYPSRNVESQKIDRYHELLNPQRVTRIYLEDLGDIEELSLGLATVKLVTVEEETAIEKGRVLLRRTQQEVNDPQMMRDVLQLIETILIYKLPRSNHKEIEAMFSLSDLKQTRVYQEAFEEGREEGRKESQEEAFEEGKLESIPRLLKLGLTAEQIAEALDLSLEKVNSVINNL